MQNFRSILAPTPASQEKIALIFDYWPRMSEAERLSTATLFADKLIARLAELSVLGLTIDDEEFAQWQTEHAAIREAQRIISESGKKTNNVVALEPVQ